MRTFRTWAAAVCAALVLVTVSAQPALAHDELITSNPTSGQQLDSPPTAIELTFSADVMTLGAAIVIADADGTDWADGEPVVDLGDVTVAVQADMPIGGYEVRWRVVSSDGHPISGLIPFTVGDADPLVRESTAGSSGDSASDDAPLTEAQAQGKDENQGAVRALVVGGSAAVVAVVAFALVSFFRRRARRDGSVDA